MKSLKPRGLRSAVHGVGLVLAAMVMLTQVPQAVARPEYFARYKASPFARPDLNTCAVCHVNPQGSGPRNEFGQAFAREGLQITASLRARFPDRFLRDRARLGKDVEIVFEEGAGNTVLIRQGKASYRLTPATQDIVSLEDVSGDAPGVPASPTAPPGDSGGSSVFDYHLVNLRTGKTAERGEFHFRFSHRFTSPVFNQSRRPFDLFGLDTFAFTGLGIGYGITDRLAVSVYRQSWERKLELGGELSVLEQEEGLSPVSLLARVAVDGRNDFAGQGNQGHFVPTLQIVVSREFFNRFSLNVDPTFVFNLKRPDNSAIESRMIAIGLGGSIKLRESLAIVGEFIPRVTGNPLQGDFSHAAPTASFGLQFRTHRHVFEILVSNSWETNTAGSALGGPEAKHIGFNLFRRIK